MNQSIPLSRGAKSRLKASAAGLAIALMAAPEIAAAQAQDPNTLGEIIVTARKRAETLQDVPVSVAVVTGAAVADQNIRTVQDLTRTLPSVTLSQGTTAGNRQIIRGIGSGDNPSFEQSVGTFIDDIYHGRSRSSEAALFDLERIEVLKGPQTTYFGNNAIAGALNIVTADPGRTFGGHVRGAYTPNFHGYAVEGAVDVPVSETLQLRLAGQLSGGRGWIEDVGAGIHVPNTSNGAIRATLIWRPVEDLTIRLKAQHNEEREKGGVPLVRGHCPPDAVFGAPRGFCATAIAGGQTPYDSAFTRNMSPGQSARLTSDDQLATITLDRSAFTLTSVTGWSRYSYDLDQDIDLTSLPLLTLSTPERYKQFSQEVRITSNGDGPIQYLAGAYYQHSVLNFGNIFNYAFLTPTILGIPAFAPLASYLPLGFNNDFRERNDTTSAFGAVTWKLSPQISVTGALRYTDVDKDFDQSVTVGTGSFSYQPAAPFPANLQGLGNALASALGLARAGTNALERNDNHLSRSLSVEYRPNASVMVYGRYDNGFKAGGFNGVAVLDSGSSLLFEPEKVDSYEIGAKTSLFDRRATLNVALFRSEYSDLQLAAFVPTNTGAYINRVQNAGGAVAEGVEIEANARVTHELSSSVAATFLNSQYTRYPNATPTTLQTLMGQGVQDLSNTRTPMAPRFAANWSVTYERQLTDDLKLRIQNQLFYKSRTILNFNNDPYSSQAAYTREDLTIAVASEQGWELAVIGKNLTDRTIRNYAAPLPASAGSFLYMTEPPRSVTLQLRYSF